MAYVSPIDDRARPVEPLAPRPSTLHGRRVVLLDIGKARGGEFLDRLEERLRDAGAATARLAKPLFSRPAPREVLDAVPLHGDLAVEALAD
ncbi:MAG: hypothetical protein M3327_05800 [Actinomycetota bacterium]|nr:hypothetical protein [Actinomycetota bacterium]